MKSRRDADASDSNPHSSDRLVRVGSSDVVPSQLGLIACVFLPKGSYVTAYAGKLLTKSESARVSIDYLYICTDGTYIDGTRDPCVLRHANHDDDSDRKVVYGFAQLCNDAIHPHVTGRKNNTRFVEVCDDGDEHLDGTQFTRVYVVTTRDVEPHEELLVPYGLEYWIAKYNHADDLGNTFPTLDAWLSCHARMERLLSSCFGGTCTLKDFKGFWTHVDENENECGKASYVLEMDGGHVRSCECRDLCFTYPMWYVETVRRERGVASLMDLRVRCHTCGDLLLCEYGVVSADITYCPSRPS